MKALRGWTISVGLLLAATAANAQGAPQAEGRAGYVPASDLAGPYADAPPPPPRVIYGAPDYGNGYGYGYGGPGPALLPPREVYVVLRENGFSPLGAPRLRGMFYSISAIDRQGDDGHLVIDARDGRIVRFVPADRFSGYGGDRDGYYGAPPPRHFYGPLEPMSRLDARPPATSKMASRSLSSVPVPRAAPSRPAIERPLAAKPAPAAPAQQSAAVQVKSADAPPAAPAPAPVEAKPAAPVIQPTQPMPKVQDLE